MIGVLMRRMTSHFAVRSCSSIDTGVTPTNASLMSAPAANAFSLPVSTMQRHVASSSRSRIASPSSVSTSAFSALRTAGRFNWIVAIEPSRVTMIVLGIATSAVTFC